MSGHTRVYFPGQDRERSHCQHFRRGANDICHDCSRMDKKRQHWWRTYVTRKSETPANKTRVGRGKDSVRKGKSASNPIDVHQRPCRLIAGVVFTRCSNISVCAMKV